MDRLIDDKINTLLSIFGGVQIDGPKWCGKTWAGLAHSQSVTRLDDERIFPLAQADSTVALIGDQPHLIDEWQLVPSVRDSVRHDIDTNAGRAGQYLLTGSSIPPRSGYKHSGAGRIAHLRMWTMSLCEMGFSTGAVSLQALFSGEFEKESTKVSLADISEWICRGGWPASLNQPIDNALYIPGQYIQAFCEDNAPREGKSPEMMRRMIMSLARNNAKSATLKTLSRDLYSGDDEADVDPSRPTTTSYLEVLGRGYIFEELPSWDVPVKARNRTRVKAKRYFTDPSLAMAALGIDPKRLLSEGQIFGDVFENLAVRDLRVYSAAWKGPEQPRLFFYHDANNLEVDVIVELNDGRWGGIEIKLGENKVPEGVKSLLAFKKKVLSNPKTQAKEPSFLMVLVGNGVYSYQTAEGVYVVPLTLLGA
jgi:predicted AAA+ superfamily ATPase